MDFLYTFGAGLHWPDETDKVLCPNPNALATRARWRLLTLEGDTRRGHDMEGAQWGELDRPCVVCDYFADLDDLGFCGTCAAKLDRDMIRQRAWEYSLSAAFLPQKKREKLRKATIARYGADLELVIDKSNPRRSRGRRSMRRRG